MAAHALLLFVLLSCLTVPAAAENVFTNGLVYLPIYLGIATIANVILVVRAWQAWRKYFRSESSALTILMLSGIAWCVPCLVQCIGTAIQGSFWGDSTGCDVMGFYSAFATYSSQMATLLIAYLTYRIVFSTVPKWEYVALVGLAIFVLSGLISMLPLIGVASYVKYDGFCYIDYRDVTHCVLWLLIMVPCVVGVLLLYVQIYKRSGLSKAVRFGLLGFWFVFLCGWVLGIPLIGFGLSNSEYPDNLNLVSGILGHLMNLINPFLYGIFWYKWFVADRQVAPQKELDTEFEVQDAYASSVPYALPAPWNTPVTPVQYPTYNGPPPVYTYDAPVAYPTYSGPLPTPAYTQVY